MHSSRPFCVLRIGIIAREFHHATAAFSAGKPSCSRLRRSRLIIRLRGLQWPACVSRTRPAYAALGDGDSRGSDWRTRRAFERNWPGGPPIGAYAPLGWTLSCHRHWLLMECCSGVGLEARKFLGASRGKAVHFCPRCLVSFGPGGLVHGLQGANELDFDHVSAETK